MTSSCLCIIMYRHFSAPKYGTITPKPSTVLVPAICVVHIDVVSLIIAWNIGLIMEKHPSFGSKISSCPGPRDNRNPRLLAVGLSSGAGLTWKTLTSCSRPSMVILRGGSSKSWPGQFVWTWKWWMNPQYPPVMAIWIGNMMINQYMDVQWCTWNEGYHIFRQTCMPRCRFLAGTIIFFEGKPKNPAPHTTGLSNSGLLKTHSQLRLSVWRWMTFIFVTPKGTFPPSSAFPSSNIIRITGTHIRLVNQTKLVLRLRFQASVGMSRLSSWDVSSKCLWGDDGRPGSWPSLGHRPAPCNPDVEWNVPRTPTSLENVQDGKEWIPSRSSRSSATRG